ncbi:MAG: AGE family epimerase/isomerase [Pseudomonadota bacterium]
MTRLAAAINRLMQWHLANVLPLWARAGVDARGGFYESLDFSGAPLTGQKRRVRVQSRQVHAFTQAARKGWLIEGEAIAAKGFNRLIETACPDMAARGCVHVIDDEGAVVDARRDLYDQAFLLLACASRMEAANDPRAAEIASNTLRFLDRELSSPCGGYREDDNGAAPRRQNPHMHLFEATMALYSATGDNAHLVRACAIERLFSNRFLDRKAGVLREFFNEDWTLDAKTGDMIEPGHMMEWAYLLHRFETLGGEKRADEKRMLYRSAKAIAAAKDAPFLPNAALIGQKPIRSARRLWPQTEFLRAALVLACEGEEAAAADAAQLIEALFKSYFDQKTAGLWCDEFDAEGRPIAKDVPASILYHLHEAVSCAAECRHKLPQ